MLKLGDLDRGQVELPRLKEETLEMKDLRPADEILDASNGKVSSIYVCRFISQLDMLARSKFSWFRGADVLMRASSR
jgi:hypothetical protein